MLFRSSIFIVFSVFIASFQIHVCAYGDPNEKQKRDIQKHLAQFEEAVMNDDYEATFREVDQLKRMPKNDLIEYFKSSAEKSDPDGYLSSENSFRIIWLAGILELKEMEKFVYGPVFNDRVHDLRIALYQRYYFYKIGMDKQENIKCLGYFAQLDFTKEEVPNVLMSANFDAIALLGWIFDEQALSILGSVPSGTLDGLLGVIYSGGMDRIKYKLALDKNEPGESEPQKIIEK